MNRRPTRRAGVLLLVAGLLTLAGSTAQAGWLFVLAAGVSGLVAVSVFWPHRLKALSIDRELPDSVVAGEEFAMRLHLHNTSRRSIAPLRIEDSPPGLGEAHVSLPAALAPGASAGGDVRVTAAKRGVHEGGSAVVRSGAPFGIVMSKRKVEASSRIVVLPRTVDIRSFPLDLSAAAPGGEEEALRAGVGDEFLGVRPYRSGDPRRAVHWRSTARAGRLIVREFQEPSRQAVEILVAGLAPDGAADSSFEAVVSAAASVGLYMLSLGHPLKLGFFSKEGPQRLEPASPRSLLHALAGAVPGEGRLDQVAAEGFRAALAAFTTSSGAPGASLGALIAEADRAGRRAAVVVADSATWDEEDAPPLPAAPGGVPTRFITKDEDLAVCLAA